MRGDGGQGSGLFSINNPKPLQVTGLEPMDPEINLQDFTTWRNRWNDFCRLQQVQSHPMASQKAALRQALGLPMQRIVEIALNIRADGPETPNEILDRIYTYLRSKRNVALDRVEFEKCTQQSGESFDDFYIRLKRIADCAQLCNACLDQRMTTRIMSGIRDSDVRKKLMSLTPFPDMVQALNLCRSNESAVKSKHHFANRQVAKVKNAQLKKSEKPSQKSPSTCKACGNAPHGPGGKCPAIGKTCSKCKGENHFAKMCTKRKDHPKKDTGEKSSKSSSSKLAVIKLASVSSSRRAPQIIVSVFHVDTHMALGKVSVTPDTGAEISVAGLDILNQLDWHINNLLPVDVQLVTASNQSLDPVGQMSVTLHYGDQSVVVELIICSDVSGVLLSWFACKDLGILHSSYPDPLPKAFSVCAISNPQSNDSLNQYRQDLIREFRDVFDEGGPLRTMTGPAMKIVLKEDFVPYAVNGARPIPFAQRAEVRRMLDEMVEQSIIAPVPEHTDWVHPLVIVTKPNGKLRLCVDLTKLNQHVKRPTHPLRSTKDVVAEISPTAKIFSTFDAVHAYWQIPLDEDS